MAAVPPLRKAISAVNEVIRYFVERDRFATSNFFDLFGCRGTFAARRTALAGDEGRVDVGKGGLAEGEDRVGAGFGGSTVAVATCGDRGESLTT